MRRLLIGILSILIGAASVQSRAIEPVISARSPELLATYAQSASLLKSISKLRPAAKLFCTELLSSQARLQKQTDSWKLYSLYDVLQAQGLMTAPLVRVPTVTELRHSLPQYTRFRQIDLTTLKDLSQITDGSVLISDKGTQCGPDPLAIRKGSYFVKCGPYLLGSGLIKTKDLLKSQCSSIVVLENASLR